MTENEDLKAEIERLRALVEDAYVEGYFEKGIDGDFPPSFECWSSSKACAALQPKKDVK
jgi:hypothetical protein